MDQEKFKFDQSNQNSQRKTSFGIWTLIISIIIAFGFGYGVGFVSSAYFRNININKELASNIQILQANNTSSAEPQKPKSITNNQAKITIQTNSTNTTKSEINAIANSLANQTNETKSSKTQEIQKSAQQIATQAKPKIHEIKNSTTNVNEQKVSSQQKVPKEQANYIVQVASFPDRSKALNLVISLIQKGYNASSEQTIINNTPYTRVIIAVHSLSQANKVAEKLKTEGITNLPIIYERKQ
ncbi:hypothetical protein DESACE_03260 [Desulfurella acetivorans A63]|nr:hypothetical protein DESACE_03260 [Desulfurella acetivorans A63]